MKKTIMVIFLGLNAWSDLRKKQILLWPTGVFGGVGMIFNVLRSCSFLDMFASIAVGLVFLVFSVLSKESVGMGDGWLLLALAMYLNVWEMLTMVCIALFSAAVWGVFLLTVLKKSRKTEIPFVPFLFLGYVGGICL